MNAKFSQSLLHSVAACLTAIGAMAVSSSGFAAEVMPTIERQATGGHHGAGGSSPFAWRSDADDAGFAFE